MLEGPKLILLKVDMKIINITNLHKIAILDYLIVQSTKYGIKGSILTCEVKLMTPKSLGSYQRMKSEYTDYALVKRLRGMSDIT